MKFSIRQALVSTLIIALSLQICDELIEITSLNVSHSVTERLEAKVRLLRQQTAISEAVVASLPLSSAEYVLAKERFERSGREQVRKK